MRTGFAFTLEHWNLYDASPAWRALTTGTTEEKIAKMRDPELRAAVKRETEEADRQLQGDPGRRRRRAAAPDRAMGRRHQELEKYVGKSLGQIGAEEASIRST